MGKQQCSDSSSPETEAQGWNTVTLGKYSWCTSLCNRGPAGTQLPQGYLIWVSKTIKYIINNSQPGINTYNPIKSFWWCQKPWESTRLPGGKIKIHPWRNYSPVLLGLPCERPNSWASPAFALSVLLLFSFQAPSHHRFWCILHFCWEEKGSSSQLQTAKPLHARTKIFNHPKKKIFFAWLKAAGQVFKH